MRPTRDIVAIILTATISLTLLSLVGVGVWAIVQDTYDWRLTHIPLPVNSEGISQRLSSLLLTVLGTLATGLIGYIGVITVADKLKERRQPPSEAPVIEAPSVGKSLQEQAFEALRDKK